MMQTYRRNYNCQTCGGFLNKGFSKRRDANYCSDGCRVKAHREREKLKATAKSVIQAIQHLQAESKRWDFVPGLLEEIAATLTQGAANRNKSTVTGKPEGNHEQN